MEKKLYKNTKDKKLCGVCSGIAEYINLDPTVVRLLWVLFCFVGAGVLVYIVAAIIMPDRPTEESTAKPAPEAATVDAQASTSGTEATPDQQTEQI